MAAADGETECSAGVETVLGVPQSTSIKLGDRWIAGTTSVHGALMPSGDGTLANIRIRAVTEISALREEFIAYLQQAFPDQPDTNDADFSNRDYFLLPTNDGSLQGGYTIHVSLWKATSFHAPCPTFSRPFRTCLQTQRTALGTAETRVRLRIAVLVVDDSVSLTVAPSADASASANPILRALVPPVVLLERAFEAAANDQLDAVEAPQIVGLIGAAHPNLVPENPLISFTASTARFVESEPFRLEVSYNSNELRPNSACFALRSISQSATRAGAQ